MFKFGEKVKCIKYRNGLTKDKIYTVLKTWSDTHEEFITVINDNGDEDDYCAWRFESIKKLKAYHPEWL